MNLGISSLGIIDFDGGWLEGAYKKFHLNALISHPFSTENSFNRNEAIGETRENEQEQDKC